MLTPDEAERLAAELWSRNNMAGDWADLLLSVAASAREAERELACADMCAWCRRSGPPERDAAGTFWHRQAGGGMDELCTADDIRRRAAGEGGKL